MRELTVTVSFIICPFSLVYIAISMDESPEPITRIILPLAFVNRSVLPDHIPGAFRFIRYYVPLSLIFGTIL